jgi:hypothetical protein
MHEHYLPILVRSGIVTDWERDFCASLIRQTNRGRTLSEKQEATLARIVKRFMADAVQPDDDPEMIERNG